MIRERRGARAVSTDEMLVSSVQGQSARAIMLRRISEVPASIVLPRLRNCRCCQYPSPSLTCEPRRLPWAAIR